MDLQQIARRQFRVVSRAQVLQSGHTDRFVQRRLSKGEWIQLAPGIYLTTNLPPTTAQLAKAALVYAGEDAVVSGLIALELHGVKRVERARKVMVLIPATRRLQHNQLVEPIRCQQMPEGRTVHGVAVVTPARAALDACRDVRTLNEARSRLVLPVQQQLTSSALLIAEARSLPTLPRLVQEAMAEIRDGIRSVAEADARRLLLRSGLPQPVWNVPLYSLEGKLQFVPDAYWIEAGVALEIQSRDHHFSEADWRRTMERLNRMIAMGILVIQAPPSRVKQDPEGLLAELRAAYQAGLGRSPLPIRTRKGR